MPGVLASGHPQRYGGAFVVDDQRIGINAMNVMLDRQALDGLPFRLPDRPRVTRIRQRDTADLRLAPGSRTQAMAGFEPYFPDIVDYIVRITEEIWTDRAIGRIYDTYAADCLIYSSYGVVRSVEEVVASTIVGLHGFPDGEIQHLNVAWDGDDRDFYTSHLGFSRSTNLGPNSYGPATGARVAIHFVADCITRDNRIHTEWLVRDNGALVRQLDLDLHEAARIVAAAPFAPPLDVSVPARGDATRSLYAEPTDTVAGFAARHIHDFWNLRRLDLLGEHYAPDVLVHWAGGREASGVRNLGSLIIGLLASLPDATMRVDHVSWSDESDGIMLAVRWTLFGTTRPGGQLGDVPAGRPVFVMGSSHWRFAAGLIVEDWTVFDEVGVIAQCYRD